MRDKLMPDRVWKKYIIISVFFGHLSSKSIRESVDVNVCMFSTDNQSLT